MLSESAMTIDTSALNEICKGFVVHRRMRIGAGFWLPPRLASIPPVAMSRLPTPATRPSADLSITGSQAPSYTNPLRYTPTSPSATGAKTEMRGDCSTESSRGKI